MRWNLVYSQRIRRKQSQIKGFERERSMYALCTCQSAATSHATFILYIHFIFRCLERTITAIMDFAIWFTLVFFLNTFFLEYRTLS